MKRGRRSSAELSTVIVDHSRRMPAAPPSELTDAQAAVWRDPVASMPGDWLPRGAFPIPIAYCRHVCRARLLEAQIARFEPEWLAVEGGLDRLDKLLKAAEAGNACRDGLCTVAEAHAAVNLSSAVRITGTLFFRRLGANLDQAARDLIVGPISLRVIRVKAPSSDPSGGPRLRSEWQPLELQAFARFST